MQNRYVGDVGDFGKYALLKALCSPDSPPDGPTLSLGVVWYLFPDEAGTGDGKYTGYLDDSHRNRSEYRSCDPSLYDALREIVCHERGRTVEAVRRRGILPPGAVSYEASLTFDGLSGRGPAARAARLDHRCRWAQNALDAMAGCDLVFIDPDNGLETRSTARHHVRGPKYATFDELQPYVERGQSLIVYHHIGRRGIADSQVRTKLAQLEERLEGCDRPFALMYRRGTSRAYLMVPAPAHREVLLDRSSRFARGPWTRHFDEVSTAART